MIDPARRLHRGRRQPDFIPRGVAVFASQKCYVSFLDIVGIRDRGGPVRRTKRPEPYVGLVFSEQRFGCAPGGDILHGSSPFFANLTAPWAGVNRWCDSDRAPRLRHQWPLAA